MGTTLTGTKKGNNVYGDINFNNDNLFISSSDNVGVGTSTPSHKLDVSGSGRFDGAVQITGSLNLVENSTRTIEINPNDRKIVIGGATDYNAQLHLNNGRIQFGRDGSAGGGYFFNNDSDMQAQMANSFYVYDSSIVGDKPSPAFGEASQISGGGGSVRGGFLQITRFKDTSNDTTFGREKVAHYINAIEGGTGPFYLSKYYNSGSEAFSVKTSGDTYISGSLGIGTTSPSYKLDVSGSANISDGLTVTGSINQTGDLTVDGILTAKEFHTELVSSSIIYESGSTKFGDTSDDVHQFTGSLEVQSGSIKIETYDNGLQFFNGTDYTSNRIKLSSAGNLQIQSGNVIQLQTNTQLTNGKIFRFNNTDNTTRFDINNAGASGEYRLDFTSGSTQLMVISGSGNVGIGTDTPSQKLHVEGTSLFAGQGTWPMRMENNVSSGNAEMGLWTVTDAYAATKNLSLVATPINNQPVWYFQAAGDGWQNITLQRYGGQVGIRTLEPSANLTVQGGGTTTGKTFLAQDSNASALFTILDNGNVGIGTDSPSQKLEVVGNTIVSGSITQRGSNGIRLYDSSGYGGGRIFGSYGMYNGEIIIHPGNTGERSVFSRNGSLSIGGWTSFANDYVGNTLAPDYGLVVSSSVGIGTKAPLSKLHLFSNTHSDFLDNGILIDVSGSDEGEPAIAFRNQSDMGSNYWIAGINEGTPNLDFAYGSSFTTATTKVTFHNNGNVGIGTTSPSEKLQVNGNAQIGEDSSGLNNYLYIQADANKARYIHFKDNAARQAIGFPSGSQNLEIKSLNGGVNSGILVDYTTGRINIGHTDTNSAVLHIKGEGATSSTTSLLAENSNGDVGIQVLDNGNVGIGGAAQTSSTYKLRVHGGLWADSLLQLQTLAGTAGVGSIRYYEGGATLNMDVYGPHASEAVKGILQLRSQDLNYTTLANSILHADPDFLDNPSFVIRSRNTDDESYAMMNYKSGSGFMLKTSEPPGTGTADITFKPSGSAVLFLSSSGNVGIGTDSPQGLFHVSGSGKILLGTGGGSPDEGCFEFTPAGSTDFRFKNSAGDRGVVIKTNTGEVGGSGGSKIYGAAGGITLEGALGQENLSLTTDGKVGIGTTSPSYKLDVDGTGNFTDNLIVSGTFEQQVLEGAPDDNLDNIQSVRFFRSHTETTNAPQDISSFGMGISLAYGPTNTVQLLTSRGSTTALYMRKQSNSTFSSWIKLRDENQITDTDISNWDDGYSKWAPSTTGDFNYNSGSNQFLKGHTTTSNYPSDPYFNINQSFLSGIAPIYSSGNGWQLVSNRGFNAGLAYRKVSNGNWGSWRYLWSTDNFTTSSINNWDAAYNVIDNGGTISGSLTVEGRADFQNDLRLRGTDSAANQGVTRFYVDNTNQFHIDTTNDGSNLFVIDGSGNVGIGNSSPSEQLDVTGNATISGVLTANTIEITSGSHFTTTGVGSFALRNDSTDSVSVTAMGYSALQYNTSSYSVGIGRASLQYNSGSYSNGIGHTALQNNQGENCSGFGAQALQNNTGTNSLGFGHRTLQNNTGNYSLGFGFRALGENSGNYTSGFGYLAAENNTGNNANAFGYQSLQNNTHDNCTAVGHRTLENNAKQNNTALGAFSGQESGDLTGQNNVFLGYDASYGTNTTIRDSVALGAFTTAAQNYTVILGKETQTQIKVGIGTNTPSSKLHIKGAGATSGTTSLLVEDSNGDDLLKVTDDGTVTINDILTIPGQHPLPSSPSAGTFAVSSSTPPKPYFYDGTSWNALY